MGAATWPRGEGEMARRIREHDWAATPLGPIGHWPERLRAAVDLILAHSLPMSVLWGPEDVELYNDAYRAIMGAKHPGTLGRPLRETWPASRNANAPLLARVQAGEAVRLQDTHYRSVRDGAAGDAWYDLTLSPIHDGAGGVAGALVTVLETTDRRRAEAALRESEAKYRTIFEALAEGVSILEVLFDGDRPVDYRFVENNAAVERMTGLSDVGGRTVRELFPGIDPLLIDIAGEVARTGRPIRFEHFLPALGRWFEVHEARVGGEGSRIVVAAFTDVTDRKRAEAALRESEDRHAFLLTLSDALRPLVDAERIRQTAAEVLGRHLRASRVAYAEDVGGGFFEVGPNYVDGAAGIVGRHAYADYGADLQEELRAGRTRVQPDIRNDARLGDAEKRALAEAGIGASLTVPLVKDGRLVALLGVNHAAPHDFTRGEIELVEEVAERTWAAVERARAEAALREGEERLRIILESARDHAIFVIDPERRVVTWPAGAEAVFGWRAEEIVGHDADILWTPEDREAGVPEGEAIQARDTGQAPDIRWHLRKDGSPVFIDGSTRALRGPDGELRGFVKIGQDVTERRRTEEALRESEARFRGFAENSADVLWIVCDGGTRVEYLSPAFERIFGEPRDRITADLRRFRELVHPDDREAVAGFMPRVLGGEVAIAHYRVVRPADGRITHLRDTGFPIRDASGAVVRAAGVVQDVNDIVAATAALEAEKERFRTLAEGIPQLVWRSAAHGHWTWASPQWTAYTGLSDEASRDLGWLDAVHPDDRAGVLAAWERVGEGGVFESEYRLRSVAEGGWRWFQTRGLPAPPQNGNGAREWLGASTEVDEAVRAREALNMQVDERTAELMAAEQSLRQAQKMEAIGQLTGGIAHDFNNMLQGVTGALDLAGRRLDEGRAGEAARYMVAARDAAGRAAGLTRRLLAFARRQRLDPRPVDADALIAGMADLLRRTVGPQVSLELVLRDGVGRLLRDPGELENAVLNLCINARDAMPEGGRLTIGTEDVDLAPGDLAPHEGAAPGPFTSICVEDTGSGIPPEVLGRVLEPFFTTKPQGQGTGLGLSQVWGFARQSGGVLRIESEVGKGTTVRILLPRHPVPAGEEGEEEAPPAAAAPGIEGTVLLVDDEDAVRGPAAERLRELGCRVIEAPDGPAALRLLDGGLRPDLLITDVGLPGGMDGRISAEAAQARQPGLPVLFITGYARVALPDDAEVITKPFALDALAARVRDILTRRG
jgi:PAS domain S-box-containing protein